MINLLQIIIVCITFALSLFVWLHSLFRSQSYKRNYFLLMQAMIIVYLFGYLLEVTSTNTEEAFTAVRVLYVGAYFVPVFTLFLIADHRNIKLHPLYIKTPMVIVALAIIIIMWTTKYHGLIYVDYYLIKGSFNRLVYTPGRLFSVIHHYPTACMIFAMGILFYQLKRWSAKYRKQIIVFIFCLAIPFVAEGIYIIGVIISPDAHPFYFTPYSMALMSFCLYLGVLRFNIFEIISSATIAAMENIREGFVLLDEESNFLSSNSAAEKILPAMSNLSKGESILSMPGWPDELKNMENDLVEFPVTEGDTRYYRASMSPVMSKKNVIIGKIFLFREITDNVNLMKELENAAYIDSLTGLYNRKHFTELALVDINRALRQNQTVYAAMLDLDFFKHVNDTHGHVAGDLVLRTTAEIINNTIRSYDLVGRYGGEEFVLLFTDLDVSEALKLMERIRENMEQCSIKYQDIEIRLTCSIGLARFTEDDSLDSSIKKADDALYAAKNAGRNMVKLYGTF